MRLPPPDVFRDRAERLRGVLRSRSLDALLVTHLPNVAYLTGFFASAGVLLVTPDGLTLIGDARYAESLEARAAECPFIRATQLSPGEAYEDAVVEALLALGGLAVGFEASRVTVRQHHTIRTLLKARGGVDELAETDGLIETLRVRKDAWEVARLRDGAERLSSTAKCILSNALEGRTEGEIAAAIELELRRHGFGRPAFDTIVASGPNAALPHARAGARRIERGDVVVLDFGGVLDGYCTDLTRTVTIGSGTNPRAERLIAQVVEAQAAAFRAVRDGAAPESVDAAARGSLARGGLAEAFSHGTGHGLGLELHEAPRVTRAREDRPEPPLAAGMVLTLEPGVYLAGWGGVRIEDDVLVTGEGAEWLTDVPRMESGRS